MNRVGGNLEFSHWNRPVAFVSQRVWLQKTTIRDNVIFGQLFDTAVYNAVLEACVLDEDIKVSCLFLDKDYASKNKVSNSVVLNSVPI